MVYLFIYLFIIFLQWPLCREYSLYNDIGLFYICLPLYSLLYIHYCVLLLFFLCTLFILLCMLLLFLLVFLLSHIRTCGFYFSSPILVLMNIENYLYHMTNLEAYLNELS